MRIPLIKMIDKNCKYIPCHKELEDCKWCFCSLYPCFNSTTKGKLIRISKNNNLAWSCIDCTWPHKKENSEKLINYKFNDVLKLYNKKTELLGLEIKDSIHSKDATQKLEKIKGLSNFLFLDAEQKNKILYLELKEEKVSKKINLGVREALYRRTTICCSHDHSFREPTLPSVVGVNNTRIIGEQNNNGFKFYKTDNKNKEDKKNEKIECYILPGLSFPELETLGTNIVSSSPCFSSDAYLRNLTKIKGDEATLLLGFD